MTLAPGSRLFVLYDLFPPELYQERLIFARCIRCERGDTSFLPPIMTCMRNRSVWKTQISVPFALAWVISCQLNANTYRLRVMPNDELMEQFRIRDASHGAAAMQVAPGAAAGLIAQVTGRCPCSNHNSRGWRRRS